FGLRRVPALDDRAWKPRLAAPADPSRHSIHDKEQVPPVEAALRDAVVPAWSNGVDLPLPFLGALQVHDPAVAAPGDTHPALAQLHANRGRPELQAGQSLVSMEGRETAPVASQNHAGPE